MPLHHPGPPPWVVNWTRPGKLLAADGVTNKAMHQCYFTNQVGPADGDRFRLFFICAGNETRLSLGTQKMTSRGIFDLYVNGVLDSAGYDDYAAATSDIFREITFTQLIRAGQNIIELRVNGKNAASTGFMVVIYGASLQ